MFETPQTIDREKVKANIHEDFAKARSGKAIAYLAIYGVGFAESTEEELQFEDDLVHAPFAAGISEIRVSEGTETDVAAEIEEAGGYASRVIRIPSAALDAVEAFELFVHGTDDVVHENDSTFIALEKAATQALLSKERE